MESDSSDEQLKAQLQEAVMEVWHRRRSRILERVELINKCIAGLENGKIDQDAVAEAIVEAHRLAGAMGSFGFPDSSEFARDIELSLESESWKQTSVDSLRVAIDGIKRELEAN
jgi:HPt (histidine-containing phosphotransfer) domain-containing protein